MTKRPNLFDFATSELSQDAFLCWLLSWADHDLAKVDSALQQAGKRFLASIFKKCEVNALDATPEPRIAIKKVKRQYKFIDILALVSVDSKNYVLVIEDKTHTTMHGEQLRSYRETAQKDFSDSEVLCVYFKTGEVSRARQAEESGYAVYSRKDFLIALGDKPEDATDSILRDFHRRLITMDKCYNAFNEEDIEKWRQQAWEGYFGALQRKMKDKWPEAGWGYAANPRGGELVFFWADPEINKKIDDGTVYLEIHKSLENQGDGRHFLAFKVSGVPKNRRSEVRWNLHESLMEAASESSWSGQVKKPKRFGHGKSMVFCETTCDGAWLVKNDDGKLNLDRTIERLTEASKLLDRAVHIYTNRPPPLSQ